MATQIEYAALSAHIYNDQRGGGPLADANKLDLPTGWQDLSRLGFTPGDNLNNYNPISFTGGLLCGQVARHYKFRSCLRPYLLNKSTIRYRKTACHARVMCLHTQNSGQSRLEKHI